VAPWAGVPQPGADASATTARAAAKSDEHERRDRPRRTNMNAPFARGWSHGRINEPQTNERFRIFIAGQ
jgi:hypothetical protein